MSDAEGVVTAINDSHATVRMDADGCGRCHEPGGCGGQNIARMFCGEPRLFQVSDPGGSRVGDRVVVSVPDDAVRQSAAFAYGLPLLALFLGAFVGLFVAGDVGAMIGAVVGVLAAWLALPRLEAMLRSRSHLSLLPRINR